MKVSKKILIIIKVSVVRSGFPLEDMFKKSLSFCKKALKLHTFPRNDYKRLCQYVIVFLEGREAIP